MLSLMDFQKVAIIHNLIEAGSLVSQLQAAGLHPLDVGASPHAHFAGTDHGYYIEVPDSEVASARSWLSDRGLLKSLV